MITRVIVLRMCAAVGLAMLLIALWATMNWIVGWWPPVWVGVPVGGVLGVLSGVIVNWIFNHFQESE